MRPNPPGTFPQWKNSFFVQCKWNPYQSLLFWKSSFTLYKSSRSEVFLGTGVLKICSKFTGEHPYQSLISIKLQSSSIEITLRHGYSAVNLLHTFRIPFLKNTSGWLLLNLFIEITDIIYWCYWISDTTC